MKEEGQMLYTHYGKSLNRGRGRRAFKEGFLEEVISKLKQKRVENSIQFNLEWQPPKSYYGLES